MRKIVFIFLLTFTFLSSYAQLPYVRFLVGLTEAEVTQYLDSLNQLKNNSSYKIERDITSNGHLLLKSEFSLEDEGFYKCTSIYLEFVRFNGVEYCLWQTVFGNVKYAQNNLVYIKDNFKEITTNSWELPHYFRSINNPCRILASFKRADDENPFFTITYTIDK